MLPKASLAEDEGVRHSLYAILCEYMYIYNNKIAFIFTPRKNPFDLSFNFPPKILGPEQQRAT